MPDIRLKTGIENELRMERARGPRGILRLRSKIDFSDPYLDRAVVLAGFGAWEPAGRWTIAAEASLAIMLSSVIPKVAAILIELRPMITPTRGQSVEVWCGPGPSHKFYFPPGKMIRTTISIPVQPLPDGAALRMRFVLPAAISPKALGMGDDNRLLGIRIYQLRMISHRWNAVRKAISTAARAARYVLVRVGRATRRSKRSQSDQKAGGKATK